MTPESIFNLHKENKKNQEEVDSLGRTREDITAEFPEEDSSSLRLVGIGERKHWEFGEIPTDYLHDLADKENREEKPGLDFEKKEEKDPQGRNREAIIKECHLDVILGENLKNLYFDSQKKEWRVRIGEKDKSARELYDERVNSEREDSINDNSGGRR